MSEPASPGGKAPIGSRVEGPSIRMPVRRSRSGLIRLATILGSLTVASSLALASPANPAPAAAGGATETVEQALCRVIDRSARSHRLPPEFLTRLIWRESSFRAGATSSAGAQGIAQFMPGTAAERGLINPFDPEEAIPKAAEFLADLKGRFGNLGLAAAAYNGGPGRLARWLSGEGGLPAETRDYVAAITGRSAEDWAAAAKEPAPDEEDARESPSCLKLAVILRRPGRGGAAVAGLRIAPSPFAPWGVQLAGNFSKERALASFVRARQSYAGIVGEMRPMIIGTRLRSRGTQAFYRVRLPASSRGEADQLCTRIRSAGGSCIVLPS
jgi:hypothetical protein